MEDLKLSWLEIFRVAKDGVGREVRLFLISTPMFRISPTKMSNSPKNMAIALKGMAS